MANEGKVVILNPNGTQKEVREPTSNEQTIFASNPFQNALDDLRSKRDALLNETDWIVTKAKETGGTIPSAWKTYRQELRDLTNGLTTVDEVNAVEFPERPTS